MEVSFSDLQTDRFMTPTVALCEPGNMPKRDEGLDYDTDGVSLLAATFNTRSSKRELAGVNSDCWGYARSLPHHPPVRPPSPATPAPVPCNTVVSPPQQQISFFLCTRLQQTVHADTLKSLIYGQNSTDPLQS